MRDDGKPDLTSLDVFLQQMLEDMQGHIDDAEKYHEAWYTTSFADAVAAAEMSPPSITKRLIEIFEGADVASIPFWRRMEDQLGGEIFFKIPFGKSKNTVDVCVFAYGNDPDLRIRALVAYTNWQINRGC